MFALRKSSFTGIATGICLFALTPLVFVFSQSNFSKAAGLLFSYQYWLFVLYFLGIYFLLEKMVIPRIYFKKKIMAFIAISAALLVATVFVKPFDRLVHFSKPGFEKRRFEKDRLDQQPGQPQADGGFTVKPGDAAFRMNNRRGPVFDIVSVFLLLLFFLIVITDNAVRKSRHIEKRAIQAEADRVNAELAFLKAQINPHFLFNTLNNIYSLAVTKSDKTPDAVMKLSNIMRYVTDEANETMVPLEYETDCITDYISLQKLRLGENFPVEFWVNGNAANKTIPPLSLMTFVENAFKHGVSNHEQSSIVFKIELLDKYIHFFAQNKLFSTARNTERNGIGIENTKKRLNVLYAEKHVLNIEEKNGFYTVDLILYN